jgi:hypothetical protein
MEIRPSETYNLERLQRWLDYDLSLSALLFFSWFYGLLLVIMLVAAVIFIPFMLKILYEERKFGWIVYFIIFVVIPFAAIQFINTGLSYKFLLSILPLVFFYFYCFTLKLAVRNWLTESRYRLREYNAEIKTDDVFRNYRF